MQFTLSLCLLAYVLSSFRTPDKFTRKLIIVLIMGKTYRASSITRVSHATNVCSTKTLAHISTSEHCLLSMLSICNCAYHSAYITVLITCSYHSVYPCTYLMQPLHGARMATFISPRQFCLNLNLRCQMFSVNHHCPMLDVPWETPGVLHVFCVVRGTPVVVVFLL